MWIHGQLTHNCAEDHVVHQDAAETIYSMQPVGGADASHCFTQVSKSSGFILWQRVPHIDVAAEGSNEKHWVVVVMEVKVADLVRD